VNVVALMYHDVTTPGGENTSGFPGGDAARYKLTTTAFATQLQAIRERIGTAPATVGDLFHLPASTLPVLLTFDDGGAGAQLAADCLDACEWRAHFFVTTDYIGRPGFLTATQIRDLRKRGHVIGSHSCSHPLRMSVLPADRLRAEWKRSITTLSDILGERVDSASVPGGGYSPRVAETASEAGARFLFTSRATIAVDTEADAFVIGRFAVRRTTSARRVAAVASGRRSPRWQQLFLWDLKHIA
jgi:peptidoglycan/xylan/chitin deacetylase (PgdA/CDA1 family)